MAGVSAKKVRAKMENLGVYKDEFAPTVERYVKLSREFDKIYKEYSENGCQYAASSGGAERKSAIVMTLETLRRDLLQLEESLGLTPRGLMKLQENAFKQEKKATKKDALV